MSRKKNNLKLATKSSDTGKSKRAARVLVYSCIIMFLLFLLWQGFNYFRIESIVIQGTSSLDRDTIITALDLRQGMSIIMIEESDLEAELKSAFPIIRSVEVARELPKTIIIRLTDRESVGYIKKDNQYWLVDIDLYCYDRQGKRPEDLPVIQGLDNSAVQIGVHIKCQSRKKLLRSFFRAWKEDPWLDVTILDVGDSFNLVAYLEDGTEIWLGEHYEMDHKLLLVKKTMPYIRNGENTCLDIRTGNRLVVSGNKLIEGEVGY